MAFYVSCYSVQKRADQSVAAIRMLLYGIRNGRFSMECHWRTAGGETKAAQIIRDHKLKRLQGPGRVLLLATGADPHAVASVI